MTHDLWANLNRVMVDFLDGVTLQQLVDEQRERLALQGTGLSTLQDNRGLRERGDAGRSDKAVATLT
jgi:Rrf2 family iron-sulfur cluster assembly transcriptional regulator